MSTDRSQAANIKPSCTISTYDSSISVKCVIDDDIVISTNGDKIRLIGLDSPEIAHGDKAKANEPGAARNYLLSLAKPHEKLLLLHGKE